MKLITEINESIRVITEEVGGVKHHFIEGVFLQGELKNRNRRIYPMKILEAEVERYTQQFVKQNRAFGELGHPEGPTINLERVSHMIKGLTREGNNFIGKAKILDTPYGKIVKSLIDEGAKLGFPPRGIGSLQEDGDASYVRDDFQLSTAADIVADPSGPDAFVRGIMEGKEWVYESGKLKERDIEEYKKSIRKASARKLEEAKLEAFKNFLGKL